MTVFIFIKKRCSGSLSLSKVITRAFKASLIFVESLRWPILAILATTYCGTELNFLSTQNIVHRARRMGGTSSGLRDSRTKFTFKEYIYTIAFVLRLSCVWYLLGNRNRVVTVGLKAPRVTNLGQNLRRLVVHRRSKNNYIRLCLTTKAIEYLIWF